MSAWAMEHWFLTFVLALCTLHVVGALISRIYRTIMVCARGWPPEHLDADGDWKPEPEV